MKKLGSYQKQLLLDMRGLINDYARDKKDFPSIDEFKEKLNIGKTSVIKYKKIIVEQDTESLLEIFGNERVTNIKNTIQTMKENIKFYKKIRDETGEDTNDKIHAAECMEKTHLSLASVMYDAPEYLYTNYTDIGNDTNTGNNNAFKQKYPNRQKETTQ